MINTDKFKSDASSEHNQMLRFPANNVNIGQSQGYPSNIQRIEEEDGIKEANSLNLDQKATDIKKMTLIEEKLLVHLFKDPHIKWSVVEQQFKDITTEKAKQTISKLMKRTLQKINKTHGKAFTHKEISLLESDYLFKIFRSLIARKIQKSDEDKVDLFEMMFNYMFYSANKVNKQYNDKQQKIIGYLLIRTMEINDMERARKFKKKKIAKKKGFNNDKDTNLESKFEENEKNNTIEELINSCERVRTIYKAIKGREGNSFFELELKEFQTDIKTHYEVIRSCARKLAGKDLDKGIILMFEDAIRRFKFCKERLKNAELKFPIERIEQIFICSDVENN